MAAPEEITLDVRGLDVATRVWGPASGPPVLALHGWLDNAASFDDLAPRLPEFRVVAVDLPGHGLSQHHPPGQPYHYVDWVTDVTSIVDALGWQSCSVVGHSMGAGIGCLFAGTFPNRVQQLVLLDGIGPMTAEPNDAPDRLATGVRRLIATEGRAPATLPSRRKAAERMCEVVPGLRMESAEHLLARGMRDVPGGVAWRADPRLRVPSLFRFSPDHVHAFLRRIRGQVLVVRGRDGYPFDAAWADAQLACLDEPVIVDVPGGHHVHLDDAGAVAPHVARHLRRLTRERPQPTHSSRR